MNLGRYGGPLVSERPGIFGDDTGRSFFPILCDKLAEDANGLAFFMVSFFA